MPRRARVTVPGIPHHIIQRGINRSACFFHEEDYYQYLYLLENGAKISSCQVHAFVLMTNHIHLLVTPIDHASLANMMKAINQRYTQFINRTYCRSGTLWEGRYKSCITEDDQYVLTCYRYIELNPVRARMVVHPAEYRWSSYRANTQTENIDWLTQHSAYTALAESDADRARNYQELFKSEINPDLIDEIRTATQSNYALGSEKFQTEVEQALGMRVRPGKRGRPRKG